MGFLGVHVLPGLCALMLFTVWPSLVLPAVLTLVCVDSKHSCRSKRPRSGRTRGSEGQWGRVHTASVDTGMGSYKWMERRFFSQTGSILDEEEVFRKERRPHFSIACAPLLSLKLAGRGIRKEEVEGRL